MYRSMRIATALASLALMLGNINEVQAEPRRAEPFVNTRKLHIPEKKERTQKPLRRSEQESIKFYEKQVDKLDMSFDQLNKFMEDGDSTNFLAEAKKTKDLLQELAWARIQSRPGLDQNRNAMHQERSKALTSDAINKRLTNLELNSTPQINREQMYLIYWELKFCRNRLSTIFEPLQRRQLN